MAASLARTAPIASLGLDKLGVVVAALLAVGAASPFAVFRANRIVAGEAKLVLRGAAGARRRAVRAGRVRRRRRRALEDARTRAARDGDRVRRRRGGTDRNRGRSPDACRRPLRARRAGRRLLGARLRRLDPVRRFRRASEARPRWRALLALALGAAAFALALWSGVWSEVSILKEYATRADVFWREAGAHLVLAVGSLAAAMAVGLPLGVLIARKTGWRAPVLNTLNAIQTIPSIALFGILIGPLGWVSGHVPGAAALGVHGIGAAPAFLALFLYSLLPMAANTVVGLDQAPRDVVDAADGMGMTSRQRLFSVELPLALPSS